MGFTSTLGILSVIQMIFLPGFIILHFFGFQYKNLLRILFFSMGLSLFFNYIVVFALVAAGLYNKYVIFSLYAIEIVLLIKILIPVFKQPVLALLYDYIPMFKKPAENKDSNVITLLIYLTLAFIFVWIYLFFVKNLGTIFNLWDDVHSWNKWAIEWTTHIPEKTWLYPQILPANWSLSYILTGTQLQFFPKLIQPLFSVMIFLVIFDIALLKRKAAYFIAVIISGIFLMNIYQGTLFLSSGHVDIATAFFALMAFYCLMIPWLEGNYDKKYITKTLILGAAFAAAAGVTKQAGLFLTVMYPYLAVMQMTYADKITGRVQFAIKDKLKFAIPAMLTMLSLALPWYILKMFTNPPGSDYQFVVALAEDMYAGAGYLQRIINTVINYPHIYIGLFLGLFSLNDRLTRIMYVSLALPYTIVWALFFSYDLRNNTMVIPMIAVCATIGAFNILKFFADKLKIKELSSGPDKFRQGILSKFKYYHVLVLFILMLAGINAVYHQKDSFMAYHNFLERNLGYPELNGFLYEYNSRVGFKGYILSDYSTLEVLPDLKQYYKRIGFRTSEDTTSESARIFFNYFNNSLADTANKYILLPYYAHKEIRKMAERKIETGEYELIFNEPNAKLIKIRD